MCAFELNANVTNCDITSLLDNHHNPNPSTRPMTPAHKRQHPPTNNNARPNDDEYPQTNTNNASTHEDFTLPHLFPWESDGFRRNPIDSVRFRRTPMGLCFGRGMCIVCLSYRTFSHGFCPKHIRLRRNHASDSVGVRWSPMCLKKS
jgi:hypothetical protein